MPEPLTINIDRPITSAKILGVHPGKIGAELSAPGLAGSPTNAGQPQMQNGSPSAETEQILSRQLEAEKTALAQACQAVQQIVNKLNQFYDKAFTEHREEIARLAVEIAGKILMQKVEKGDYEIEPIIKETLKNAPAHQDLVLHLNPADLAQCQKLQQEDDAGGLAGVKLVADANVGRAQCVLESPKGIIESLIDKHLEQIFEALKKAE